MEDTGKRKIWLLFTHTYERSLRGCAGGGGGGGGGGAGANAASAPPPPPPAQPIDLMHKIVNFILKSRT